VASSSAAAKRDPAVTVPSPPPKKGSNNKTAPFSSSCNQQYASRIQNVSSNPTSNTAPSEQVVTRRWSKGAVVKQINAVQDESTKKHPPSTCKMLNPPKKPPPQHICGLGLRKSPPELNVAAVITKSPTNSVAAAASTLICQKNYVDGNIGGRGGEDQII
jgi:hypothetical protein